MYSFKLIKEAATERMLNKPGNNMFHDDITQFLRIDGNPMPLNRAAAGILPGILIIQGPPVIANPTSPQRQQSNHRAAF